ncbi:MAG: valine--tRNA ligase [Fidelibacterota bacterium]|nr:MAG: valine--tRNA ligase [Candidatus Neomarinimicrobiota bacterium]
MKRVQLGKVYEPGKVESKWYRYWEEQSYFQPSDANHRDAFTIVIPPPNVTGILTMGHVLNNTIQDILIRRARMQGRRTLWLPGTDHASIATEAKIVRVLREEGTNKASLGRERFLEKAWDWAHQYGGTIIEQLKRLGCTCDWSRSVFTMDEGYSNAVIEVFVRLYEAGMIYRGERLINWDPVGQTALSDEEVIHKETQGQLWYFRYPIKGSDEFVTVATTRPETMLGDTGVAVHPKDDRYSHLVGKTAVLPLVGRDMPIIADDFVDPEFGTGAVKVTPAHDPNDYELGARHGLESVNILHPDATLNDKVPEPFRGLDRFKAREAVVSEMERQGLVEKIEPHVHNVGYSERTDAMVEPYLSLQWFLGMKELADPAREVVDHGRITFYPERWVKVYHHWLTNTQDWCISRQLWWGHRIPAWYGPDEHIFVARTADEARAQAREHYGREDVDLRQDPDVLDTWFSSWLWPFATMGWPEEDNPDLKRFYPTSDLVTAPDIIFFWVARMVMAGLKFMGDIPFSTVYFNGIVRDKLGRRMSKSLGNSPDPLEIIDQYGADALRMGMMLIAPQGLDILFSEEDIGLGRNYMNKIWNAARFVLMNVGDQELPPPLENIDQDALTEIDRWILSRLQHTLFQVEEAYARYRMNEVARTIHDFIWSDYCDWYLEFIKSRLQGEDSQDREVALGVAIHVLRHILLMIHPLAPFISEELWQQVKREGEPDLIVASYPTGSEELIAPECEGEIQLVRDTISSVRAIRSEMNIDTGKRADLVARGPEQLTSILQRELPHLHRLARVGELTAGENIPKPPHAATAVVGILELFIPLEGLIDLSVEKERLQKRIQEMEGRLASVQKKLDNENFLRRAPAEVVAHEKEKQTTYHDQLDKLQENLKALA